MRRFTKLQRNLIKLILVCLIFLAAMVGLRQNAMTNIGYSAWTYLKYGLIDYPLTSLANVFSDVANLWHVYDENKYLNEQLAKQRSYETLYDEEKNKNQELQKLVDLKGGLSQAQTISAQVLSRQSQSWLQTVTVSAGNLQGVKENMLVSTSEGVVGLVEEVQSATCTVRLLTSQDLVNDVAVTMALEDGTNVEGVLESYDSKKRAYRVSLFDHDANITAGQLVATSGSGGNYPAGIFVGTVMDIEMNDDAIISTVYVKPVNNMQSFHYVMIIGNGDSES